MKIQHLTLGGNSVIRDTKSIRVDTLTRLWNFRLSYTSQVIDNAELPFKIKITATDTGAVFDIQHDGDPAITNFCCFRKADAFEILSHIKALATHIPFLPDVVRQPSLPKFLYTIVINPFALSPENIQIAGEVELYIYYQLCLAWKKQK